MDYYHVWCDLKDGSKDLEFCGNLAAYLGHLKENGLVESFTLTRRKFGFGPPELGDFHVIIRATDLGQLDRAFLLVATREGEVEALHRKVFTSVMNLKTALYRDFPDSVRKGI